MRDHLETRHPHASSAFVNAGANVTVTIGRNVGSIPMDPDAWENFRSDVVDHLSALLKPSAQFAYFGTGEWEGVREESVAILLVSTGYTARESDVAQVLTVLASNYDQDAIGWSHGAGHLATADAPARELVNA